MLLFLSIAWSACPPPEDEALEASLEAAQDAFDSIDWEGLTEHTRQATRLVPCATTVLSESTVASVFRLHGWALFSAGHKDAQLWLGAAYGLAPRYRYQRTLRGPMATAWSEAQASWSGTRPAQSGWIANGGAGRPVSDALPWVVQRVDAKGAVSQTHLVGPGGRDPTLQGAKPSPTPAPKPTSKPAPRPTKQGNGLSLDLDQRFVIAGGAGMLAGLGLMTTAAVVKGQYQRNPSKGLYTTNLVTATSGLVLFAGGASVAVVGVLK